MHVFIQDLGKFGCIVVAAETETDARTVMATCDNYDAKAKVTEQPLPATLALIHCNLGDL